MPPNSPPSSTSPPLSRAARFGSTMASSKPRESSAPAAPRSAGPVNSQTSVVGLLERIRKVNEDWSIGSVYTDERQALNVVGPGLRDLVEGNEYTFNGSFVVHSKYGKQLDVVSAMPYVKPDRNSIVKYIAKNFKGVGPITAENFLKKRLAGAPDQGVALEAIRQQLLNSPWTMDFTGVTKKAKYKNDAEASPVLAYVHRDLATRLGGMPGVKDRVLKLLASYLLGLHSDGKDDKSLIDPEIVQKCWASLVQDPYAPCSKVPGYAFLTADAIGQNVNIPRDAEVRLKALVAHALELGCQRSGHVYLTRNQLTSAISKFDARVPAETAIQFGLDDDMILFDEDSSTGVQRFYTPKIHDAEVCLAQGLANLCRSSAPISKQPRDVLVNKVQAAAKILSPKLKEGLDSSQVDALVGIMTSNKRLHTLTAGPGCGKTQLMEVLAKVMEHKDFIFCGPTGKSAKVLSNRLESQGLEANTIHSTLQGAGRGSFVFSAGNQLEGDIIVCDEASMNDVEIAESIVAASNSGMHIIFMGDDMQLPSIGPGSFLQDILKLQEADHHRLTKTHRNSGGILDVINQVRQGGIECNNLPGVTFSHGLEEARLQFPEVAASYINAVSKYGFENVILLMALRAGDVNTPGWNATYSNGLLRDLCNPHAVKIPGTRLHIGDRIIIRENMMVPLAGEDEDDEANQVRVVNGDTGTIQSMQRDSNSSTSLMPKSVRLKLDDGRSVDMPGSSMDVLQHAYALTVHSAQGSEYKKVIAVFQPGHPSFINQSMLLTGLSRARESLEVIGEDAVLRKIAATPLPPRNSALVERVEAILAQQADKEAGRRTSQARQR